MAVPLDEFGWPVAAADPAGAELCSFAPVEVSELFAASSAGFISVAASEPVGAELCC